MALDHVDESPASSASPSCLIRFDASSLVTCCTISVFCSAVLITVWTKLDIPSEVVRELLLDIAFSAFSTVDMQSPFRSFIGATYASTVYGHGGVVARIPAD